MDADETTWTAPETRRGPPGPARWSTTMASTTLTVAVSTKAWAAAVKVAERLVGPDDSYTPVDVVADAVCQFRAEVGRDPLDMVELQRHADGEDVDTTPVEVLTVASLREML